MRTRTRLLIALGALATAAVIAASLPRPPAGKPAVADATAALYATSLTDLSGQPHPLAQWRGQVLVVNFWATWCPPCLEEMPELSALQEKYRGQGLTILGISTDDVAKMQEYAHTTPVSYPLLSGDIQAMELAEQLGNDQSVLPYTVVLRRDGSLVAGHFGRLNVAALERSLQPLLAAAP